MKFLIFNLVVGAALVYLFTGTEADFQNVADRAYKATSQVKAQAVKLAKTITPPKPKPTEDAVIKQPLPQAAPVAPAPPPATAHTVTSAPLDPLPTKIPEPKPQPQFVADVSKALTTVSNQAPIRLDPEVAKRQATVLDLPSAPTPIVTDTSPDKFMSARDRRAELVSLAESMELFSAEAASQ